MTSLDKDEIYKELQKELEERKRKNQFYYYDEFITIELDAANNWLYVNWIGYQTEASVKHGCEKMLLALTQYNSTKVLNDNTHVVGIWTPASEWVGADWLPRMKAAGLRHFAWVYSPSRLSQVSQKKMISMPPAIIIMAQLFMGVLTGGWGLVLATPFVAMIIVVVQELWVKRIENRIDAPL